MLYGREHERARIDTLVDEAWAGRGGALVVRGLPGVGKSALLQDTVARQEGTRVLATRGIESESPLAFAALHRLLRPVTASLVRLPAPQQEALRAAFGEQTGGGDRFLVFLATLNLLAEVAEQAPVLCVVDDAHWLDDASAAALLFVARRLGPERVALLFAARDGDVRRFESDDLPELVLGGLDADAATALLRARTDADVADSVRTGLLAQTGGNPLALVELPRALSARQLAGAEPLPRYLPLTDELHRVFLDRSRHLSTPARTLLLVVAADDSARIPVIRAALTEVGVTDTDTVDAAFTEAERSGLIRIDGGVVELQHPLVRSALYRGATTGERRRVHAALAAALRFDDPDRRAWHLATGVDEPDESVAAELEQAAERAHRRGGFEAASAALERAAALSPDTGIRAIRLYEAAAAAWLAGRLDRTRTLAEESRRFTTDPVLVADLDRLRGRVEFNVGSVPAAVALWTRAAREVAAVDPARAREIAMIAVAASTFAPEHGRTDLDPRDFCTEDPAPRERCLSGLLVGFHHLLRGDVASAVAPLRVALESGRDLDEPDLLTNTGIAASFLDDAEGFRRPFDRLLTRARTSGSLGLVLFALPRLALAELSAGRFRYASANAAEALQLARSTGQRALTALPLAQLALDAALRGEGDVLEDRLRELDPILDEGRAGVFGELLHDTVRAARGVHDLVSGRNAPALGHFDRITHSTIARLVAYDRLDAAVQAGRTDLAERWTTELTAVAEVVDSPATRAVAEYGRALLADGAAAESHFRAALDHHTAAARPFEAARTHLAYGVALRRARRRVDARAQLRAALGLFEDLGVAPWVERARTELRASGESARRRAVGATGELTPQERQVARLVAQGLPNREVAAQMFLSPRTIDFHLRNVFTKTGISSRGELVGMDLG